MNWHERFGFVENPFSIKRKDILIGQDVLKLKEKILQHIASEENVLIYGRAGLGKTTLAEHLRKEIVHYKPTYLYCKKFTGVLFDFEAELRKGRGVLDFIRKKEKVLLLDEFNKLHPDMVEQIISYYDDSDVRAVVIFQVDEEIRNSSQPNQKRIFSKNRYEMPILGFDEMKKIITERLGGKKLIDDDALKLIYNKEGRITREVLLACSGVCQNYLKDKIRVKDVQDYYKNKPQIDEEAEESKVKVIEAQELPALSTKATSRLSPLQKAIIKVVVNGPSDAPTITKVLGKDIGSIGKQLSILWKDGILEKDSNRRPVKYSLKKEYKDLYMTD